MKTEIQIECEDDMELLSHLRVIVKQIRKEIKRQKGEIIEPAHLQDSNCYGDHSVIIIPECQAFHFPDGNGFCLSCGSQLDPYAPNNILS